MVSKVFGDLFFESKPMASKSWIANGSTSMVVFTAPKRVCLSTLEQFMKTYSNSTRQLCIAHRG